MKEPSQIPLAGEPLVEITDATVTKLLFRLNGMTDALDAVAKMNSELSGVKLAVAAIESEYHQGRCVLLANLNKLAAKAGVDGSRWLVAGAVSAGGVSRISFVPADEIDK